MAYSVKKNWILSFEFIWTKPVVILPFFIIAFLEGLALELLNFSAKKPISIIAGPIIRKFFGENALHYPGNILILPDLFYYAETAIYIFISVFLIAISINVFKNIRQDLPVKRYALIKNALKQYPSFIIFGIIMICLIVLLKNLNLLSFSKITSFGLRHLPGIPTQLYSIALLLCLFFSNCVLQVFLILTLPLMVIEKKSFLKALGESLYLAFRNFFSLFGLILLPYLVYFPVWLLKVESVKLAQKTFPEVILYIIGAGIIIGAVIDCFIFVCASQFILYKEIRKSS